MINEVMDLAVNAQPRNVVSVHMMVVEEVGELARAINRPERCDEPAISECADVFISTVDQAWVLFCSGATGVFDMSKIPAEALEKLRGEFEFEFSNTIRIKLKKWESHIAKARGGHGL